MSKEYILWGIKNGEEDWQEVILTTNREAFDRVKELATADGYGRFRVSVLDLSAKPDFAGTVNIPTARKKRSN